MAVELLVHPQAAQGLALAMVAASNAPLLLLAGDLTVIAASTSFTRAFHVDPATVRGGKLFELGAGEWDTPRLRALLSATVSGQAQIEAYEMDLVSARRPTRRLLLNA
ncbi:MAG: PAS domain-containing protein [Caulobacterales bacterium]